MNPSTFRLRLFGGASIERHDGTAVVGRAAQRHRMALLALLSCGRGAAPSREKLIGLLWPESDDDRGRNLLNVSLYVLRKALGNEALISAGDELRLDPAVVACDVGELEEAMARGEYEAVVALYRGPLLDGFFVDDAPEFERWVDAERARLGGLYARALEALAGEAAARRDFEAAVAWWRRSVAHDPYDSRVAYSLMRALDACGNRAGALQHAALHERLLREELGVEAAAAVSSLATRLRAEPVITPPPSPARTELPPATVDVLAAAKPAASAPPTASEASPSPSPSPPTAPRAPRRRTLVLACLAVGLVVAVAVARERRSRAARPLAATSAIAVLPLANLGSDPRDAALAAALTEELMGMLAREPRLRVAARTSAYLFEDSRLDVQRIADSLQVAYVIEGGLQREGRRVRVQVRLVDARDGATRWSRTFDRELADLFAVQSQIATDVARELGVHLGAGDLRALRQPPTRSIAAYELYLRGNDPAVLRSDSGGAAGMEHFRQAIALDSGFAGAWAGLARMYVLASNRQELAEAPRTRARAADAAARALALDGSLAEAHTTAGFLHLAAYEFLAAETELTRAIAIDPGDSRPRELLARVHHWRGRPADALAEAERAVENDPLSPSANAEVAWALCALGQEERGLERLRRLDAVRPPLRRVPLFESVCHLRRGDWPAAIARLRAAGPAASGTLAYALARAGRRTEALAMRAELERDWQRTGHDAFEVALADLGLGQRDSAFAWLDRVREPLTMEPNAHLMLPMFDAPGDPRLAHFMQRIGAQKR